MKVLDTDYETLDLGTPAPGVVVVTLNRPERYIAMTATMFGELERAAIALDGSVSPRVLDAALTDRLTAFTWDGTPGRGIFEFALTRSPSYAYQPTLP